MLINLFYFIISFQVEKALISWNDTFALKLFQPCMDLFILSTKDNLKNVGNQKQLPLTSTVLKNK